MNPQNLAEFFHLVVMLSCLQQWQEAENQQEDRLIIESQTFCYSKEDHEGTVKQWKA